MNLKLIFISLGLLLTELLTAQDQTTELSLKQVIEIARMESPDAQTARHSFRSAYWNYKYYRANYLPSLSLTSDPNLNRAINKITMGDGSVKFVEQNLLNQPMRLINSLPWPPPRAITILLPLITPMPIHFTVMRRAAIT